MTPRQPNGDSNGNGNGSMTGNAERFGIVDVRIRGIEADVYGLKADVTAQFNSISSQIASLATKIDERGRIPWPALGVMLGFITVIGGMAYLPIKEAQNHIETDMITLQNTYVSEKQLNAMATAQESRRGDVARALETRFASIESNVAKTNSEIVPRVENQNAWDNYRLRHEELQRQIDELKRDYSNLYSPKDEIASLQSEIREIERRLTLPRT